MQDKFFKTLPEMPRVKREEADIAWFLYDLKQDRSKSKYQLIDKEVIYTKFEPALRKIVNPEPEKMEDFLGILQQKLDEKLDGNPPDAPTLIDTILC